MYNVTIEVGNGIEASFAVDMAAIKGEQGIQGVKGDTGKGFTILGTYATVEALAAAVTNAEQGDYYNVGTEAPYRIYMWDDAEGWQDQGQLQGPKGDPGDVQDVQVAGVSVLKDGVANVPNVLCIRDDDSLGVANPPQNTLWTGLIGISAHTGTITIATATTQTITARSLQFIGGTLLDYAVKAAMCDGKGKAWTASEQKAARERMGIDSDFETDPTVPSWAKAATKPSYSATEVGADPSGAASEAVTTHNASSSAHASLFANKQNKIVTVSVNLPVAGWSSNTQTVSVSGVTPDTAVQVTYDPACRAAWIDADVYCSAQGAGTLTFACDTVPTAELTANIVIIA